jgi:hypothetical protein
VLHTRFARNLDALRETCRQLEQWHTLRATAHRAIWCTGYGLHVRHLHVYLARRGGHRTARRRAFRAHFYIFQRSHNPTSMKTNLR